MLSTSYVIEDKKEYLCAALHLDDSARIQSLREKDNPLLYEGIQAFYKKTGIPVICNTSLNDKGEPIVDCFEEVLNFALRKGIRLVYLNGFRVLLQNHNEYKEKAPYKRKEEMFLISNDKIEEACNQVNPEKLTREQIDMYLNVPELAHYNIKDKAEAEQLKRILKHWKRLNATVAEALLL